MRFLSRFMPKNARQLLLVAGLFAAFMLSSALIGQYGFSLYPCELCIYQRYPYIAIIALSLVGYWVVKSPAALRGLLVLCALLFLADAGIAFYHTGVEYGWFKGPDGCSNASSGEMTLEEMRAQILNAPLVSCSQAMAYIFGLSMAAWNAILASLAFVAMLLAMRKTV